jgi:hypothetical protein
LPAGEEAALALTLRASVARYSKIPATPVSWATKCRVLSDMRAARAEGSA